jgi:hypothetical protein
MRKNEIETEYYKQNSKQPVTISNNEVEQITHSNPVSLFQKENINALKS